MRNRGICRGDLGRPTEGLLDLERGRGFTDLSGSDEGLDPGLGPRQGL